MKMEIVLAREDCKNIHKGDTCTMTIIRESRRKFNGIVLKKHSHNEKTTIKMEGVEVESPIEKYAVLPVIGANVDPELSAISTRYSA